MAESGGEDEGQNLLAVVVDINPNQVTTVWTNGNRMQSIGNTLIAKEETVNHFFLVTLIGFPCLSLPDICRHEKVCPC